jgi:hypothetical protein
VNNTGGRRDDDRSGVRLSAFCIGASNGPTVPTFDGRSSIEHWRNDNRKEINQLLRE